MLGFHTASLFGPTYDRVFDGVVPPRTGAVSVINRVSCMCCEPGRAARLVHLAGASRVADGLDRCPGVPGGSKMTCLYVTPVCTTRVDVRARIWRFLRRLSWRQGPATWPPATEADQPRRVVSPLPVLGCFIIPPSGAGARRKEKGHLGYCRV